MGTFSEVVERAAGIGAGVCAMGAPAVAPMVASGAFAGIGLYALFRSVSEKSLLHCERKFEELTGRVRSELLSRYPEYEVEFEDASVRLSHLLSQVVPDPEQMATLAHSSGDEFAAAGTRFVLDQLKAKGGGFDRHPAYKLFAERVVATALACAFLERETFADIEPHLWVKSAGLLRTIHEEQVRARERLALLHGDVRDLLVYKPALDLRLRESGGGRLFFFGSHDRLPFLGRRKEMHLLDGWLQSKDDFSWTLINGPGGAGKSRMALELCLGANGWRAGFLSSASVVEARDFVRFRPEQPTLLVLDYVGEDPERAGSIIQVLIDLAHTRQLSHPVRVLLLERESSHASWWSRFVGVDEQRLGSKEKKLDGDQHLRLGALDDDDLWTIVELVAGPDLIDRATALPALRVIDPKGRPLFAALAADAVRNGHRIFQLSRQGLMHDVLKREQRRWNAIARTERELHLHENAAAVATLVGSLALPDDVGALPERRFPFAEEVYNAELVRAMVDAPDADTVLLPIEPDIVGEWFVLQLLQTRNAFDQRSTDILSAAERLASQSTARSEFLRNFRARAVEDFSEETLRTDLLRRPPSDAPEHVWVDWAASLVDAAYCLNSADGEPLIGDVIQSEALAARSADFEVNAADAVFNHALTLVEEGHSAKAHSLFRTLLEWSRNRSDAPDVAWTAAKLGRHLGAIYVENRDIESATVMFETLRIQADFFRQVPDAEKEEIAECAVRLGFDILDYARSNGLSNLSDAYETNLWRRPTSGLTQDLADASALVLATERDGDTFEGNLRNFVELKQRAAQRPDAKAIPFWAANSAFNAIDRAKAPLDLYLLCKDLAEWLALYHEAPDMWSIVHEIYDFGWVTPEHVVGKTPIEALHRHWCDLLDGARRAGREASTDNEVCAVTAELQDALQAHKPAPWAISIASQIDAADGRQNT